MTHAMTTPSQQSWSSHQRTLRGSQAGVAMMAVVTTVLSAYRAWNPCSLRSTLHTRWAAVRARDMCAVAASTDLVADEDDDDDDETGDKGESMGPSISSGRGSGWYVRTPIFPRMASIWEKLR